MAEPSDDLIQIARTILDSVTVGSLSTLAAQKIDAAEPGGPYASLVLVGQAPDDGAPVLLLSGLARHTQNLQADPRASLLLVPTRTDGEGVLEGARLTLQGRFCENTQDSVRAAFLDRHEDAADYVDFADFSFWRMDVAGAHLVAGFGRITEIPVNRLILKRF